jgi:glucuronate isomerase
MKPKPLVLHADRAFPAEPSTRAVARRVYAATRDLPLVCMHGHVPVELLAEDRPFDDPAQLLVVPDHYVTRMLHSHGVSLEDLGIHGRDLEPVQADPREIWRRFCAHWHLFRGTPSRYWLEHELAELLGVDVHPSAETADLLYDAISARLRSPQLRPRALLDRFRIELLATTDGATATLEQHRRLAVDGLGGRVIPTFRPDALVHLDQPGWLGRVDRLAELTGADTGSYPGYLAALRSRRQAFVEAGALATDHGHSTADTAPLSDTEAGRLYADARAGRVGAAATAAFAAHMLYAMAEMCCADGLVMQLHPGVLRDHDRAVHVAYGPDRGFDIPVAAEFTRGLRPLLEAFGSRPEFRLVLFTVDESTYSRELAPIAGIYPAVRLGAPWWFLDSPYGMRRFRELTTETAGFYNTTGFVDDTRGFASIPARHDLDRRIDAGVLARLVTEHRLDEDEAIETAVDLAYRIPKEFYARQPAGPGLEVAVGGAAGGQISVGPAPARSSTRVESGPRASTMRT